MATLTVPSLPKSSVPSAPREAGDITRLVPCSENGKILQAIELGDEHRAMGDFENAWSAYSVAIVYWLRLQWMSHKNQTESVHAEPTVLLNKLKAALLIDAWAFKAIGSVIRRPVPVGWLHADIAAGIVKAICKTS